MAEPSRSHGRTGTDRPGPPAPACRWVADPRVVAAVGTSGCRSVPPAWVSSHFLWSPRCRSARLREETARLPWKRTRFPGGGGWRGGSLGDQRPRAWMRQSAQGDPGPVTQGTGGLNSSTAAAPHLPSLPQPGVLQEPGFRRRSSERESRTVSRAAPPPGELSSGCLSFLIRKVGTQETTPYVCSLVEVSKHMARWSCASHPSGSLGPPGPGLGGGEAGDRETSELEKSGSVLRRRENGGRGVQGGEESVQLGSREEL